MANKIDLNNAGQVYIIGSEELKEFFNSILEHNAQQKQESEWLSKREVMERLGKSQATLWRWGKEDYLVPKKIGGRLCYKREDVERIAIAS